MPENQHSESWIAIVGMACHFPGADTPTEFWENIKHGIVSRTSVRGGHIGTQTPRQHGRDWIDSTFCCAKPDHFDAKFFGYSPAEASLIDPQQRLLLHTAWEAVEDAGYDLARYSGTVGVFVGVGPNLYAMRQLSTRQDILDRARLAGLFANDKDFASMRIAHSLDLHGPAIGVQTACSTSLVAVHLASQSLLMGECDMALVGGASIRIPFDQGYETIQGSILSPSGSCRAFDAMADGTVPGSGAGIVLLKRFNDAVFDKDHIVAVLRGTVVNNNGGATVGFTRPSSHGQAKAISLAHRLSDVAPGTIGLVEAHGTGTKIGDPIEIEGLKLAFGVGLEASTCAVGSVKSNIGHLDTAAGIAGLMKVALALKHRALPPSANFAHLNENISFDDTPFYICRELQPWREDKEPRRACVSSFGIGGTNAHAVLEEIPFAQDLSDHTSETCELLLVSARTTVALGVSVDRLSGFLSESNQCHAITNIAFTLAAGRRVWPYRGFILTGNERAGNKVHASFLSKRAVTIERPLVFVVSGHLPSSADTIERLRQEFPDFDANFRSAWNAVWVNRGSQIDLSTALDMLNSLPVAPTLVPPLVFSLNYSLARLFIKFGLNPQAILGYGIGDYVAGCLSGLYDLEEMALILSHQFVDLGKTKKRNLLSVESSPRLLKSVLPREVYISAVNTPTGCVISGAEDVVEQCIPLLEAAGISYSSISGSRLNCAPSTSPVVGSGSLVSDQTNSVSSNVPWSSSSHAGTTLGPSPSLQQFWENHAYEKLDLCRAISNIPDHLDAIYVEIGIGSQLRLFLEQAVGGSPALVLESLSEHQEIPVRQQLLDVIGRIWADGGAVDLQAIYSKEHSTRVPLPTYPFDTQRFWIDSSDSISSVGDHDRFSVPSKNLHAQSINDGSEGTPVEKVISSVWSKYLGIPMLSTDDDFFALGGDSLVATSVFAEIRSIFPLKLDNSLIYTFPTIRALAQLILEQEDGMRAMRIAEVYLQVGNLSYSEVQTELATRVKRDEAEKKEAPSSNDTI